MQAKVVVAAMNDHQGHHRSFWRNWVRDRQCLHESLHDDLATRGSAPKRWSVLDALNTLARFEGDLRPEEKDAVDGDSESFEASEPKARPGSGRLAEAYLH